MFFDRETFSFPVLSTVSVTQRFFNLHIGEAAQCFSFAVNNSNKTMSSFIRTSRPFLSRAHSFKRGTTFRAEAGFKRVSVPLRQTEEVRTDRVSFPSQNFYLYLHPVLQKGEVIRGDAGTEVACVFSVSEVDKRPSPARARSPARETW